MIKVRIGFETKKNNRVETLWGIRQEHPYPTIVGSCGTLEWENGEGLFPQWRPCDMEKPGIGQRYRCDLLRTDTDGHDLSTRVSSAGYDPHPDGKKNPGTFALRGVDLGEMSIEFGKDPQWADIRVRGFDRPSPSEREFIKENIVKVLAAAVDAHRDELKAEAIRELRLLVAERLKEARERLSKMDKEITDAIDIAAK
ncbi:MAG: hypothetical protein BWY66_00380 [bacterium ADurb.Bin374]|nr:MAG: hypothetical protein BWY66_00380 [bacterium ADurb.Bin374]